MPIDFSRFIPQPRRSNAPGWGEIAQIFRQPGRDARADMENDRENTRANAHLKIAQDYQSNTFSDADKKEVEGLFREYEVAKDQGDPIAISRATQKLERFGWKQQSSGQARALPGALPTVARAGPITPEESYEDKPTTGKIDFDLDAPEVQAQAKLEPIRPEEEYEDVPATDKIDFDADAPGSKSLPGALPTRGGQRWRAQGGDDQGNPTGAAGREGSYEEAAGEADRMGTPTSWAEKALPGALPTFTRNGKSYQAQESGRWAPMVAGAFEAFLQHPSQEVQQLAQQSQAHAAKLIQTEGYTPKQAIEAGMKHFEAGLMQMNQLERTKLGSKPQGGGGAAPAYDTKGRLKVSSTMDPTVRIFKNENVEAGIRGYSGALTALNSDNPASQYDALNQLIAARSGKTVSDRERALYDRASGLWEQVKKKFNMAAGVAMPEEYRNQLRQLINEAQGSVVEYRNQRAKEAGNYHRAKMRGAASPEDVEADSQAVESAVKMGGAGAGEAPGGPTLDDM